MINIRIASYKRLIVNCFFFINPFLVVFSSFVSATTLQTEHLTQRIAEQLPHDARWGLTVLDLKSRINIVSAGNTTELLSTASLVKLITTGAVLEQQKERKYATLTTEIFHDGQVEKNTLNGNIYLRGNGNCFLTADDLKQVELALKRKGIQRVTGRIVADENRFDTRGLERSRKGAGHTPAGALGLDLHTVSVTVTPAELWKPPVVSVTPSNASVRFAVPARTIAEGSSNIEVIQADDNSYRVSGDIARNSDPLRWRFPLSDPALFAAQSFKTILTEAGIYVPGNAQKGKTPADAITLISIPGPTMEKMVREMNINSLNVVADNLLLALGAGSEGSPGTREKGLSVLRNHLERMGISAKEIVVADGSGLLPGNRATTHAMAHYMVSSSKQPWFPAFYQSLPRAGMDGTLRNGSFIAEHFRAKSGSLENVAALAGYGVERNGREIAFAFIVNTPGLLPPNARNAGDFIMRFLAEEIPQ